MVFTGNYEHTIDAKNRLAIPSELRGRLRDRAQCSEDQAIPVIVTVGEGVDGSASHSLYLYTEPDFNQRAAELYHSELDPDELLEFERLTFSLSRRVEVDKQGRVRLPDQLLKMVDLGTDVVVLGNNDHLEVHNKDTWNDYFNRTKKHRPELLMNFRRAMRKRPTSTRDAD